ncbi:MAG: hypothetical protein IJA78_04040 [Clostridia bacterium]|nr:hypothetical protein [Clostridia bacterium]
MSNCYICSSEYSEKENFHLCQKCKMLVFNSCDDAINFVLRQSGLEENQRQRLTALEQKYISDPLTLTVQERKERELWLQYHPLIAELTRDLKVLQKNKSYTNESKHTVGLNLYRLYVITEALKALLSDKR